MTDPRRIHLVTDHAVLRYIERALGIDVDAIRAQLVADGRAAMVEKIGYGKIRIAGGDTILQVRDGRVVTVKTVNTPRKRNGGGFKRRVPRVGT